MAAPNITIGGADIGKVEQYRYLGSLITSDTSCEKDIQCRIALAQASFQQLFPCLFSRQDISIYTKMRVYLASVRSVLLYSCESWNVTSALASTLDSCEMNFFRRILGVSGNIPRTPNVTVRQRCHMKESLTAIIKRRRLTWLGHVLRMKPTRIPHQILMTQQASHWRSPRGRPQQTWDKVIHAETRALTDYVRHSTGNVAEWSVDGRRWLSYLQDLAASRDQWRQIVEELFNSS